MKKEGQREKERMKRVEKRCVLFFPLKFVQCFSLLLENLFLSLQGLGLQLKDAEFFAAAQRKAKKRERKAQSRKGKAKKKL